MESSGFAIKSSIENQVKRTHPFWNNVRLDLALYFAFANLAATLKQINSFSDFSLVRRIILTC